VRRDRDTSLDGTLEEEVFVAADAQWNTVAVYSDGEEVLARVTYVPYGASTLRNDAFEPASDMLLDLQHRYASAMRDPTGLYSMRARYYNPMLGRFGSRDPLSYVDGLNDYGYTRGNPSSAVDPFGTQTCVPILVARGGHVPLGVLNETRFPGGVVYDWVKADPGPLGHAGGRVVLERDVWMRYREMGLELFNFMLKARTRVSIKVDCRCIVTGECEAYVNHAEVFWTWTYSSPSGSLSDADAGQFWNATHPVMGFVNPISVFAAAFAGFNHPRGFFFVGAMVESMGTATGATVTVNDRDTLIVQGPGVPPVFRRRPGGYTWECRRIDLAGNP
jgi:RHS repeat-associated protein